MKRTVPLADGDGDPIEVTIVRLDRPQWSGLIAQHPPRRDTADRLWNESTFPIALIAASTGLSRKATADWWEASPESEANRLFEECLRLSSPGSVDWAIQRLKTNPRLLAEVQAAMRAGISHAAFLEWPNDSQDYAIAVNAVENDRCPGGCGASRSEMQNPVAYKAVRSRCLWCQQLEAERSKVADAEKSYVHISLIPKG